MPSSGVAGRIGRGKTTSAAPSSEELTRQRVFATVRGAVETSTRGCYGTKRRHGLDVVQDAYQETDAFYTSGYPHSRLLALGATASAAATAGYPYRRLVAVGAIAYGAANSAAGVVALCGRTELSCGDCLPAKCGSLCVEAVVGAALAGMIAACVVFFPAARAVRSIGTLLRCTRGWWHAPAFEVCHFLFSRPSFDKKKPTSGRSFYVGGDPILPSRTSPFSASLSGLLTYSKGRDPPPTEDILWVLRSLSHRAASVKMLLLLVIVMCCCCGVGCSTSDATPVNFVQAEAGESSGWSSGISSTSIWADLLKRDPQQPVILTPSQPIDAAPSANTLTRGRCVYLAAATDTSHRLNRRFGDARSTSPLDDTHVLSPTATSHSLSRRLYQTGTTGATTAAHSREQPSAAYRQHFVVFRASRDNDSLRGTVAPLIFMHLRKLKKAAFLRRGAALEHTLPSSFTDEAGTNAACPSYNTQNVHQDNSAQANGDTAPFLTAATRRLPSAAQESTVERGADGFARRLEAPTEAATGEGSTSTTSVGYNALEESLASSTASLSGGRLGKAAIVRLLHYVTNLVKPQSKDVRSLRSPGKSGPGDSGHNAMQHAVKNFESDVPAPIRLLSAVTGSKQPQEPSSSSSSAGATQSGLGSNREPSDPVPAGASTLSSPAPSPVKGETGSSLKHAEGDTESGASSSASIPTASQKNVSSSVGSTRPGEAPQASSASTLLSNATSQSSTGTASTVSTAETATQRAEEKAASGAVGKGEAPALTASPTMKDPSAAASPTIAKPSLSAAPGGPAVQVQLPEDVSGGATGVITAPMAAGIQATGKKPAGSEETVNIGTPQTAVVVPAVLQQEVDADQQLVRVTIPLLPSMRFSPQSQVASRASGEQNSASRSPPSQSDSSGDDLKPLVKAASGSERNKIAGFSEKGDEEREDHQTDDARREGSEQDSASARHDGHRSSASSIGRQAHAAGSGSAGETLEEMSSNEKEIVISTGLLTLLVVLAVSLVLAHASRKCRLDWLQMPVCATMLGLIVGAGLKFWLKVKGPLLDTILAMNEDVFFVMLLPPIIFEGGLGLSEGSFSVPFMRNFGAIMWLACFCTIVSFCWVGCLMFFGGQLRLSLALTVRQAFAFGALISSTDPVSVLALFKDLHAKRLIHVLVFGESLLNDAISIVLYRTVASEEHTNVGTAILAFFLTFFVSLLVGLAVGLFCALTYKYMDLHKEENQILESALLLLIPWIAYLVADGAGYSGIVAICFCGVAVGKYAFPNLSAAAQATSRSVFTCFSLLAETVVFVFLGLAVFSFNQELYTFPFGLYALGFVATFTARGVSIYVTCLIINFFRTSSKITGQQQLALALCGLRGAIAFALSERASHDFGGKEGAALLSLTLWLALFTILVLGPSLVVILDYLGVFESRNLHVRNAAMKAKSGCSASFDGQLQPRRRGTGEFTATEEIELCDQDGVAAGEDSISGGFRNSGPGVEKDDEDSLEALTRGTCGSLKRMLLHIDERYMIPIFTHSDNRHHQQRQPRDQHLQQHSEDGGTLWPEDLASRGGAGGSRRRRRFSPVAIGRLTHFLNDGRLRGYYLPTVVPHGTRAWRPFTACTENGRRTSQESGSSGRISSRSAATAPPGRSGERLLVIKSRSTTNHKSNSSPGSNSSTPTGMERDSGLLLQPQCSRSTSTSGSSRARSHKRMAENNGRGGTRRLSPDHTRSAHADLTPPVDIKKAVCTPQRIGKGRTLDSFLDDAASADVSAAAVRLEGPRSGFLSWTGNRLKQVSLGILAAAGADRGSDDTPRRRRVAARQVLSVKSKKRGGPAAATPLVTGNLIRRRGAAARSSSRGLRVLLSGASTTRSSGGTRTTELFSSGRTRRRTYAGLPRQRQAPYEPLKEQPDQVQQQDEEGSSTVCVDPVALGALTYGAATRDCLTCEDVGSRQSATATAITAGASTHSLADNGPIPGESLHGTSGESEIILSDTCDQHCSPEAHVGRAALDQHWNGCGITHEQTEGADERSAATTHTIGASVARADVAFHKQTTHLEDWSSLSRNDEFNGHASQTIRAVPAAEPQCLLPLGTPSEFQQQLEQQWIQELHEEPPTEQHAVLNSPGEEPQAPHQ